jgi:RHS repeat-associated protein
VWQYEYTLKDHLGNTRVTFADIDGSRTIQPNAEINQINHYYPFGLNMEGNWNGASADAKNKYQYNGKELQSDFGLDWNNYGARHYDAATGRFTTIDPLADIFAFQSSYAYAANNPIKYIDFMGMGPVGADGMTNEQWMNATNPANNGSQATNGRTAATSYQQQNRNKEVELRRKGQSREVNDDDIAASSDGSNIVWEGYRTDTKNVVDGFHFDCGCGGKGQPPCKGVTYRYNRNNGSGSTGFRMPDFYALNVGIPLFMQYTTLNINLTIDRHKQVYFSPIGFGVGYPMGRCAGLTASWLLQSNKPSSDETYNFLSGNGAGISGGLYGVGVVYNHSPDNNSTKHAFGFGIMTPQIGASYNLTPDWLIRR